MLRSLGGAHPGRVVTPLLGSAFFFSSPSPLLFPAFPPFLAPFPPVLLSGLPQSCGTNPSYHQAAGVQARSDPMLGPGLPHFFPPLQSAPSSSSLSSPSGLLHTALTRLSRQKENVNPSPRTQPFPLWAPEATCSSARL